MTNSEFKSKVRELKIGIVNTRKVIYHEDHAHLDTNSMILLLNKKLEEAEALASALDASCWKMKLETSAYIITDKMNSVEPFGRGGATWGHSDTPERDICLQCGVEPTTFYPTKELAEEDLKKMPHKHFKILKIEIREV